MHCTDRRRLRNKRDKKPAISSQLVGEISVLSEVKHIHKSYVRMLLIM